jgi:hypothetical protein
MEAWLTANRILTPDIAEHFFRFYRIGRNRPRMTWRRGSASTEVSQIAAKATALKTRATEASQFPDAEAHHSTKL